jgi:uncharacterized protein YjbJ (UPF0337 family)
MNEDRIAGAAETLGGKAMVGLGDVLNDDKMVAEGHAHRRAGKVRNIVGSLRDMVGIDLRRSVDRAGRAHDATVDTAPFPTPHPITSHQKDDIMNDDQLKGALRDVKGKIEKGAGDITSDTKWQADGIVDQVAGKTQNLYGRAKEKVQDVIDDAPGVLSDAGEKVRDVANQGRTVANEQVKQSPWTLIAAAGIIGYGLSWLVHGKRA